MGRTCLQPQAETSDRHTRISNNFLPKFFTEKFSSILCSSEGPENAPKYADPKKFWRGAEMGHHPFPDPFPMKMFIFYVTALPQTLGVISFLSPRPIEGLVRP